MKVSRRAFSRGCVLTASSLAIGETTRIWAQVQGEQYQMGHVHPVPSVQDTETRAQKNARMEWFREARFGMFIHWGLYSIPAGRWNGKEVSGIGEWIMNSASIPVADYKALAANSTRRSSALRRLLGWRNRQG
jgi:alpha-L-fucosidase